MNDEIQITKLVANNYNPRKHFDDARMKELEKSIKNQGIVTAITVRPVGDKFEVVAGMRRFTAAKAVGLKSIPALIKELSDDEAKLVSLTENLERADLTPMEEARSFADYLKWDEQAHFEGRRPPQDTSAKLQMLAGKLPISERTITTRLNLLHLPETLQIALDQKVIFVTVGEVLSRLRELWSIYKESGIPEAEIKPLIHGVMEQIASQVTTEEQARDRVNSYIRNAKENVDRASSQVELVQKKFDEAEQALVAYLHSHDLPENIATEDAPEIASWLSQHIESNITNLSDENLKRISDRRASATAQWDRYNMNLEYVKKIVLDTCPHCGAGVNIQNLQKRIDELDGEIKALNEEEGETGSELTTWRAEKKKLEPLLREYTSQKRTLESSRGI